MADAAAREARKKELLIESTLLREKLAVEVLTVIHTPNAITNGFKIFQKVRAIGAKSFLIGGGLIALLLLKPWRLFSGKQAEEAKAGLFSTLMKYAGYILPVVRFVMSAMTPAAAAAVSPLSGIGSFLFQKIGGLFSKSSK